MSIITVADILELNILKDARIVAGKQGLNREVNSVNVYDNPPSQADVEIEFIENDIYLSFLYFARDDISYLDAVFERLSATHAAALIVFDEYFQALPEKYVALFDEAQIPVIITDYRTPYSAVISSIIKFRMYAEQRKNLEDKITSLIGNRISQREKMEIVSELNPNFEKNALVLFAIDRTNPSTPVSSILNICNAVNQNARAFATEYRNGILIVLTYSDNRLSEVDEAHERYLELVHQNMPEAIIGVSDVRPLQTLGTIIAQSYTALTSGRAGAGETVYYKNIGISRILIATTRDSFLKQCSPLPASTWTIKKQRQPCMFTKTPCATASIRLRSSFLMAAPRWTSRTRSPSPTKSTSCKISKGCTKAVPLQASQRNGLFLFAFFRANEERADKGDNEEARDVHIVCIHGINCCLAIIQRPFNRCTAITCRQIVAGHVHTQQHREDVCGNRLHQLLAPVEEGRRMPG